ncbi:hypothetical protein [Flavobacterium sp. WC2430]|jgi:hypothetical protein|uniref:Uncharacterized protein n=3 Tax=unclassified Flavobacterium TaxID=196869 RepID=A0AB39WH28_9FLAO
MINSVAINNKRNSITLFLMFAFILLSNVSFSQTQIVNSLVSNTTESTNEVKQENNKAANMEFVLWFMGSKQDPNSTISTEGINTKKQIMTSGLAPNRLLIKAFLKKAVNFESALA